MDAITEAILIGLFIIAASIILGAVFSSIIWIVFKDDNDNV